MPYTQQEKDAEDRLYQERARLNDAINQKNERKMLNNVARDNYNRNNAQRGQAQSGDSDETLGVLFAVLGAAALGFFAYVETNEEIGPAIVGAVIGGFVAWQMRSILKWALWIAIAGGIIYMIANGSS